MPLFGAIDGIENEFDTDDKQFSAVEQNLNLHTCK